MFVIAGASGKTGRVIADTLLPEDPAVAEFHAHRRRMIDAMAAAIRARRVPHVVFLSVLPDGNGCRKGGRVRSGSQNRPYVIFTPLSCCLSSPMTALRCDWTRTPSPRVMSISSVLRP